MSGLSKMNVRIDEKYFWKCTWEGAMTGPHQKAPMDSHLIALSTERNKRKDTFLRLDMHHWQSYSVLVPCQHDGSTKAFILRGDTNDWLKYRDGRKFNASSSNTTSSRSHLLLLFGWMVSLTGMSIWKDWQGPRVTYIWDCWLRIW